MAYLLKDAFEDDENNFENWIEAAKLGADDISEEALAFGKAMTLVETGIVLDESGAVIMETIDGQALGAAGNTPVCLKDSYGNCL